MKQTKFISSIAKKGMKLAALGIFTLLPTHVMAEPMQGMMDLQLKHTDLKHVVGTTVLPVESIALQVNISH